MAGLEICIASIGVKHAGVPGVKGVKIRLSRTLIFVLGGLLLVGGSGAAALYVGADKLLGPSWEEVNGLKCTTLQEIKLKREGHSWVRRFVFAEGGDGPQRLKTAIRVAKAVQHAEKADLVQITVLDKSGPTQRAAMRGRAIGAQVIFIPDTSKAPDPADPVLSGFYLEGAASHGEYFGLKITPPLEDLEAIAAGLKDMVDCVSPVVPEVVDPHAAKPAKGAKGGKGGDHGAKSDHGAAPAHGEASGHDKPAADNGHGEKAPADGHAPAAEGAGHGEAAKSEGGLVSSLTNMIFGNKTQAAEVAAQHSPEGQTAETAENKAAAGDHTAPSPEHTAVAEQPGFLDKIKGMIFGGDKPVVTEKPAAPAVSADGKPKADEAGGQHAADKGDGKATGKGDGIDPMKVAAPTDAAKAPAPEKPPAKQTH